MNLGLVEERRGNYGAAKTAIAEAQRRRTALLSRDPQNIEVRRDRAMGYYNLGALVRGIDEPTPEQSDEAVSAFENAIADFEVILAAQPGSLQDQSRLVLCRRILGDVYLDLAEGDKALDAYSKARVEVQRLADQNPLVLDYQKQLAGLDVSLAELQLGREEYTDAIESLQTAIKTLEPLADKAPDFRRDLAVANRQMAIAFIQQQQLAAAVAPLEASVANFKALHEQNPKNDDYRAGLEQSEMLLQALKDAN